ncbi:hypothetical protein B566_EDAN015353 [Ephemera danica]|nr:hypothetical protein B566_EDAN015353 [Ephemera danica]
MLGKDMEQGTIEMNDLEGHQPSIVMFDEEIFENRKFLRDMIHCVTEVLRDNTKIELEKTNQTQSKTKISVPKDVPGTSKTVNVPLTVEEREKKWAKNCLELNVQYQWQRWEVKLLNETVSKVALNQLQAPFLAQKRLLQEQMKAEEITGTSTKKTRRLIDKVIKEIGHQAGGPLLELLNKPDSIDWMRIAASEFDGRRTANECQAMWNACLAPGAVAASNQNQDWDEIAEKHGYLRTGYQCFLHWQTVLNRSRNRWSEAEDKLLIKAVSQIQQGDYIPFAQVAAMLPGRTPQQCHHRWTQTLNPQIYGGPFKGREDAILFAARQVYCMGFKQISLLLPGRTPNQLRLRYNRLELLNPSMSWTNEEDSLLAKLVAALKSAGRKISFTSIASHFPKKNCHALRNRYFFLERNKKVVATKKCHDKSHKTQKKKHSRIKSSSGHKSDVDSTSVMRAHRDTSHSTRAASKLFQRSASPTPETSQHRSDSPVRANDLTSSSPNIPVPTPSNLSSLVKLVHKSSRRGRKTKNRDYIDLAFAQVFRSHYTQPRGRSKKYFSNKDIKSMIHRASSFLKLFHSCLDWKRDEDVAKCQVDPEDLLLLYRRLHQQAPEGEQHEALAKPGIQLPYLVPPNVTTLIGMRTLLLEQRGLLEATLKFQLPEMQAKVLKNGGIFHTFPNQHKSRSPSPQEEEPNLFDDETQQINPGDLLDLSLHTADDNSPNSSHQVLEPVCKVEKPAHGAHSNTGNDSCPEEISNLPEVPDNFMDGEDAQESIETKFNPKLGKIQKPHLDPETAQSLFNQRFLALFYWPSIMSQVGPSIQTYDGLFEGDRLSYVSDYEEDPSEAESAPENNEPRSREMPPDVLMETETETEDEVIYSKASGLTKTERRRMLKERWNRYREEKRRRMEQTGVSAREEMLREEEEAALERKRRREAEVVRIPGKRGRPARRRRVRRRKLVGDKEFIEEAEDTTGSQDN